MLLFRGLGQGLRRYLFDDHLRLSYLLDRDCGLFIVAHIKIREVFFTFLSFSMASAFGEEDLPLESVFELSLQNCLLCDFLESLAATFDVLLDSLDELGSLQRCTCHEFLASRVVEGESCIDICLATYQALGGQAFR